VNLVTELHAVCATLVRAQIRYAICGGVAVTIHGATRSTKDIDILIAPTDVDKALYAVRAIGYKFAALPLVFDEGTARERHVQRVSKIEDGEHLSLEFLLEREAFAGLLANTVEVVLPEGPLWVVPREALLAMKRMAGRNQDLADLEKLEAGDGGEQ
jgi:hypothetical protein